MDSLVDFLLQSAANACAEAELIVTVHSICCNVFGGKPGAHGFRECRFKLRRLGYSLRLQWIFASQLSLELAIVLGKHYRYDLGG